MSGIAGIFHFDGKPVAPGVIENMTALMKMRGPDGIHHWQGEGAALGNCLLHTTPESVGETLPRTNDDGTLVLVLDGRVDNWQELRELLLAKGHVLHTHTDAELVLRAYEQWGEDCLRHIDGDFAFAIWNQQQRSLFCARDRMGVKPFFYFTDGNLLVFASELAPILATPGIPAEVNQGVLTELLASKWLTHDETLWKQVLRLPAAHVLLQRQDRLQVKRYWQPDLAATLQFKCDEEYFDCYREVLADCVRRLSRTHLPLAVETSGGLDSSALFSMAQRLKLDGKLLAPALQAYTLAYTDDANANELVYTNALAAHWGVNVHEVPPSMPPAAWFENWTRQWLDVPPYPNSAMWLDLLSLVSAQGSRVVFNGRGGDEWIWGSRAYYAEELAAGNLSELLRCFSADVAAYGSMQSLMWLLRHGGFPLLPVPLQTLIRQLLFIARGKPKPYQFADWLSATRLEQLAARPHPPAVGGCRSEGQHSLLETLYDPYLASSLLESERLYTSYQLEGRSPLCSKKLVEFMFAVPERLRMRGDSHKFIHVQAMRELMPALITERRSKGDYAAAFRQQLATVEPQLAQTIPTVRADWLATPAYSRLLQACRQPAARGWPLWNLWNISGCHTFVSMAENIGFSREKTSIFCNRK